MNPRDRDPLEIMSKFPDPEPDPALMKATIAQSRDAFARRQGRRSPTRFGNLENRLRQSLRWLIPVSIGAFALVAAVVVAPRVLHLPFNNNVSEQVIADSPTQAPPAPSSSRGPAAANPSDTRMGMQPGPGQSRQIDPKTLPMSIFSGDDVRLGFRLIPSALLLYLPDISSEKPIENQGVVLGEEVEILAAFSVAGKDLVAVRIRVDAARFWRAYRPIDGSFARDQNLSNLIQDAPDKAEAERRLAAD